MKIKIKVLQFEHGNQGELLVIDQIEREAQFFTYYGPDRAQNGCCSPVVKKQTYLAATYKGVRYSVRKHSLTPTDTETFEIVLPGRDL